eukprot:2367606-Prymnesium_polylepis.1
MCGRAARACRARLAAGSTHLGAHVVLHALRVARTVDVMDPERVRELEAHTIDAADQVGVRDDAEATLSVIGRLDRMRAA